MINFILYNSILIFLKLCTIIILKYNRKFL